MFLGLFGGPAKKPPVVLLILDGWGYAHPWGGNAISMSETPNYESLMKNYPFFLLGAAETSVGLPSGQPGNSEVGHMTIGSGQSITQHLTLIGRSIEDGSFFQNPTLLEAMKIAKEKNSKLHILGMLSRGGLVHGDIEHIYNLVKMAKDHGLEKVYIHGFSDGRDAPLTESLQQTIRLVDKMNELGVGKMATITGRFYAMDRNKRWDRTQITYEAMLEGKGAHFKDPQEVFAQSYSNDITDEYIKPSVIVDENDKPVATIDDDDVVIFANFRNDRTRQLSYALAVDGFNDFRRHKKPNIHFASMVFYAEKLPKNVAYRLHSEGDCLAKAISNAGLTQYHIAETQKFPHVTFFINGGAEEPFKGESRKLITSIENVTYDKVPRMSVDKITSDVVSNLKNNNYDTYIINFANADMVGHTGDLTAIIEACEAVDQCIGEIWEVILKKKGTLLLTADHGNAEEKIDIKTGRPNPEHSKNDVPFVVADAQNRFVTNNDLPADYHKELRDVAPTMLYALGLDKAKGMTGNTLVIKK